MSLSKAVKERMWLRRERRRIPKRRRETVRARNLLLGAIKVALNSRYGTTPATVHISGQVYQATTQKAIELRAQWAKEDKAYFNGWRKGYK